MAAYYDPAVDTATAKELLAALQGPKAVPQADPTPTNLPQPASAAERVLAQYRQPGHAAAMAQQFRALGMGAVQPYHLLNMARLAEHLRGLPEDYRHFDMEYWQGGFAAHVWQLLGPLGRTGELVPGMCGTVACAVGHAPNAGMGVRRPFEGWYAYSKRLFTHNFQTACFSASWAQVDNTARGAAARMLYCIDQPQQGRGLHPDYHYPRVYADYVA